VAEDKSEPSEPIEPGARADTPAPNTIDPMPITDPVAASRSAMDLRELDAAIADCFACPRLVAWREETARTKVARFRDETYWARPIPGYGDPNARILLVGLAPAAHGGNRTGRVFTGDESGEFLWRALHAQGLSDRPVSRRADDGLTLPNLRVAAAVRCAPPANKPTREEQSTCRPYLVRELQLLAELRVILALGAIGWDAALRSLAALGHPTPRPKPRFGHGAEARIGPYTLLGSYHPSQQNTFTGKLTQPMLQAVLARGRELAGLPPVAAG
jgi:uracil-DNA glycosylase family 4